MESSSAQPCSPLSDQKPERLYELSRGRLLRELSAYFQSVCPPEAVECDYTIWKCSETGLEFAVPAQAGNEVFYNWIGGFPSYYPKTRWEYARVLSRIREVSDSPESLLDVGCGDGNFLQAASVAGIQRCVGVDFSRSAVATCSRSGIQAFCGSLQDAFRSGIYQRHSFNFVTSFHCLEHVKDPLRFVEELLEATSPAGRIFLSTPASPMSFETSWFDVMNHPPHHLTRWGMKAYQKLAKVLNLQIRFYHPRVSCFSQAVQAMKLKTLGPRSRTLLLVPKLLGPHGFWEFQKIAWKMWQRSRRDPWSGSDVVLVEFQRP